MMQELLLNQFPLSGLAQLVRDAFSTGGAGCPPWALGLPAAASEVVTSLSWHHPLLVSP